jgi:hypothetical protein
MDVIRFLAICLLVSMSSHARASDWVLVFEADGALVYLDAESIRHVYGNVSRAWVRYDLLTKDADGARSFKLRQQVNCFDETLRTEFHVTYTEPAGRGRVVSSIALNESFRPVIPDTSGAAVLKQICSRRPRSAAPGDLSPEG